MLGISYGELFLLLGATAALIGPKDLPLIARTAGRLSGRAIGYVQMARGQLDSVMQQTQARQVHKELQDTIAQLEAIRHEIRTISFINPGPLTTRLVDNIKDHRSAAAAAGTGIVETGPAKSNSEGTPVTMTPKDFNDKASTSSEIHSQATAYAKLAEITSVNTKSENSEALDELTDGSGNLVLPVSAKSAGLLPDHTADAKGSDIVLEAIIEADVAQNAKKFFSQPQDQMNCE
ncbi:hypothetical protein DM860_011429 [Cuscuta australis]|uniref:Sec-independent protein translocase protein TatB n=1 Tax=Cuscuta australis TaxID=267555 RepID=A0A328DQH7_9ASTE|nr:hypothetical protein DM860_011429 [Cuscuta australis]